MNTCIVTDCNSIELVYSGVDALMLGGIPTEKVCYDHANIYAQVHATIDRG
jgi:hypothetical protein